jgi:HEAT repeat protein
MVVLGLGKSRRPEAINVLLSLLADKDVSGYATSALAKLALPEAASGLERMLGDKRAWVRKDAKRGLAKMQEGRVSPSPT